jgi:hypothetical protein
MMVELKIFRTTPPSKSLSDAIIGMNFLMVMILFEMKRRYLAPKVLFWRDLTLKVPYSVVT